MFAFLAGFLALFKLVLRLRTAGCEDHTALVTSALAWGVWAGGTSEGGSASTLTKRGAHTVEIVNLGLNDKFNKT